MRCVCACIPRPAGVSLLIQTWRLSDPAPNPPAPSDLSSLCLCGPVASAARPWLPTSIISRPPLSAVRLRSICAEKTRGSINCPSCLSCSPVWPPDVCYRYISLPLNRGCLIAPVYPNHRANLHLRSQVSFVLPL